MNELYALFLDIYKRFPEWHNTTEVAYLNEDGTLHGKYHREYKAGWRPEHHYAHLYTLVPIYTIEYLLEKLPKKLKHPAAPEEEYTVGLVWDIDIEKWTADYTRSMIEHAYSDIPIFAVSSLVIKLNEAGELKS